MEVRLFVDVYVLLTTAFELMVTSVSFVHDLKTPTPKDVTLDGITILGILLH